MYAVTLLLLFVLFLGCDAMTKQQLKNSSKMFKKSCMGKHDVTEEQVGSIDKGKFVEDKEVMCYVACILQATQLIKNNKLNYEASIKQIDMMYPPEMKENVKKSIEECKHIADQYKDICEASFWVTKCMYNYSPKDFMFP